jgi:hypothetical protein
MILYCLLNRADAIIIILCILGVIGNAIAIPRGFQFVILLIFDILFGLTTAYCFSGLLKREGSKDRFLSINNGLFWSWIIMSALQMIINIITLSVFGVVGSLLGMAFGAIGLWLIKKYKSELSS